MDVKASVQKINQTLAQYSFGSKPKELYQPMHYMLELDQTRMCPLLTFWGCYLFSGDTKKALMPGIGVEVFYNFLMVHEDILSRNLTRNGVDSVQVKWNDNVAILSGDAMIFKAYELMIQVDQKLIKPVIRLFNQCFTSVCEGKQLALNLPDGLSDSDDNLKILKLKSGALTEFSFQLGALIGGATKEQGEQAGLLGNNLGVKWALSSNINHQSLDPSILQSLSTLDCDHERKQEFELWVMSLV